MIISIERFHNSLRSSYLSQAVRASWLALAVLVIGCGSRGVGTVLDNPPGGSQSNLLSQTQSTTSVTGVISSVTSSTEFVFQTGAPHGLVPVTYAQSMVVPSGTTLTNGLNVTVVGQFNQSGDLTATSVTVNSTTGTVTISGTVTAIVSGTKFVFQTGAPHGFVPVTYSQSMVVPSGQLVSVGNTVSVIGAFTKSGQLTATKVTISTSSDPGPYHIATWANDLYFSEGSSASAASVSKS